MRYDASLLGLSRAGLHSYLLRTYGPTVTA